jgi:hypothetical protein
MKGARLYRAVDTRGSDPPYPPGACPMKGARLYRAGGPSGQIRYS